MSADPRRVTSAGVLICDDTALIRKLVGMVIGNSDGLHVVGEATDGCEAVAEAKRLQPDVIVLDLAMPRRGGLEALAELRRVAPEAQVVIFSGFASQAVVEEALALGAATYLEKGASPDMIVASIERALAIVPATPQGRPVTVI
jgi:DNA-binding NarL/FixJ family response regulator